LAWLKRSLYWPKAKELVNDPLGDKTGQFQKKDFPFAVVVRGYFFIDALIRIGHGLSPCHLCA